MKTRKLSRSWRCPTNSSSASGRSEVSGVVPLGRRRVEDARRHAAHRASSCSPARISAPVVGAVAEPLGRRGDGAIGFGATDSRD